MLSFKNLEGLEGIDKLNECVPIIDEIFSDEKIFKKDATFAELATPIYKKHTESVNKLFDILGERPTSSAGILATITNLLIEMSGDSEIMGFFIGTCKNLRNAISVMQNTVGGQSKGTSNM